MMLKTFPLFLYADHTDGCNESMKIEKARGCEQPQWINHPNK